MLFAIYNKNMINIFVIAIFNRKESTFLALKKAENFGELKGAVLASDAFFPFSFNDSVEVLLITYSIFFLII